ncbi:MAG: peptidoglycan editing factor PgeF [Lachnospiraceae bacterium]|nr:peptidoglycan editing factor PgeF [Lachnospiraceae bacterium]
MDLAQKIKYRQADRTTDIIERESVTFLSYKIFDGQPVKCGISTRLGGVSTGHVGTMNMSTTRGDDPECVVKNHLLFAKAVGYDRSRLVMSDQIHETRILKVQEKDAGGGVLQRGVDGLMTDVKNLPLMTFYADCVPLMFYDKMNQVIAMAHSGWKGTVAKIGAICLSEMNREYGTNPGDVLAAIGPCICQNCYEVDEPLLIAFREAFGAKADEWFVAANKKDHYLLDLASACRYTMEHAGVPAAQIAMPDLCTCCNPEFLFSHRASGGKRGNLSVVLSLV